MMTTNQQDRRALLAHLDALTDALDDPERFGWTGLPEYAIAYAAAIRDVKAFLAGETHDA